MPGSTVETRSLSVGSAVTTVTDVTGVFRQARRTMRLMLMFTF